MGDLLKDLARTRPFTPDVDPERMERDLARIVSLPRASQREWTGAPSFTRRFGPVLVAFVAVALIVLVVLPSNRSTQLTMPPKWWHVLTRHYLVLAVGDPANPYFMRLVSDTDEYFAPGERVKVSQLSGVVAPRSPDDQTRWVAAGSPNPVPIVSMHHALRIGPMKPGAWKDHNSAFGAIPFADIDKLPADVEGLRTAISRDDAMRLMIGPLRTDQRHAVFALLRDLSRDMGQVVLPDGRTGVGVALPPVESAQFGLVENQLIVDERTAEPIVQRQVTTTARHGLPAGAAVVMEEYRYLGADGQGPPDVTENREVESPIIEK